MAADVSDVLVIGAGPAGLTAALYAARFLRSVVVLHDEESRALGVPLAHNVPGFPDGVSGEALIDRMTQHAVRFGARVATARVASIGRTPGGFVLNSDVGHTWKSRSVILASGARLNQIDLPGAEHERAISAGILRYCPVCDGYEHSGKRIGVIGCDTNGAAEALFLRRFSDDVTLMPLCHPSLSTQETRQMVDAGVTVKTGALRNLEPQHAQMGVRLENGEALVFDVIYPALGCQPRTLLAEQLGLQLNAQGCLAERTVTDSDVPGFFAAGDVVEGLDQISVAMGHGALAATRAHNWLREQEGVSLSATAG